MSCFNPLVAVKNGTHRKIDNPTIEKNDYKIIASLSRCVDQNVLDGDVFDYQLLPCGKCLGCRLDRSREWANRMCLELDHSPDALFLTLTYSPENVFEFSDVFEDRYGNFYENDLMTLCKDDFVLFLKRLRDHFSGKTLRFYFCGEYGSLSQRPHGHYILYGLTKEDLECEFYKFNKLKQPMYISRLLESIWKKGFCVVADASWNTMAYTSRYVCKKILNRPDEDYQGRIPEFSLMSRMPGIGMYYMDDHPEVFETGKVSMRVGDEVKEIYIPKAFLKRLEKINPDMYNQVKRDSDVSPALYRASLGSNLSSREYFAQRYEELQDRTSSLLKDNLELNLY